MIDKYYLPSKITIYLRRIAGEYKALGDDLKMRVIITAKIYVREGVDYDNWNGGMDGHEVLLFLAPEVYGEVTLARKKKFEDEILAKLRECARSQDHEYFSAVRFEDEDENDPEFQTAISLSERPPLNPDLLSIWKPGHIRLFISHRDEHKAAANELAEKLEEYGICSFVAHDTIQPMASWQHEIIKGLETMEVMLAFITDGFHKSVWTNQEVGFALGRGIPVVSFKVASDDPAGFIGGQQALKGSMETIFKSVPRIYLLLAEKLGQKDRLQTGLVTAFIESPSFTDTKDRFDRMKGVVERLSDQELAVIVRGFKNNDQLHGCVYLTSHYRRLEKFLFKATGKDCHIKGKRIIFKEDDDGSIPF